MYDQIIVWVGLALLLVLCLPIRALQKLLLEVYAWALRLALLALLAAGTYLWYFPDRLPAEVTDTLSQFPRLRDILPPPGTPPFGVCAAGLVLAVFLPVLAVLDVTRKLAGQRLSRLRILTATKPAAEPASAPAPAPVIVREEAIPAPHRTDRRTAAEALASAGARKPLRTAGSGR
jgi:hypothetical protein